MGGVAHRVANTGNSVLSFAACWPSDAGHNYEEIANKAGVDTAAYMDSLKDFKEAAGNHNDKIADLNDRYEKAVEENASDKDIEELREEGAALNKITLEAFKIIQEECTKTDDVDVYTGHPNLDANISLALTKCLIYAFV